MLYTYHAENAEFPLSCSLPRVPGCTFRFQGQRKLLPQTNASPQAVWELCAPGNALCSSGLSHCQIPKHELQRNTAHWHSIICLLWPAVPITMSAARLRFGDFRAFGVWHYLPGALLPVGHKAGTGWKPWLGSRRRYRETQGSDISLPL